MQSSKMEPLLRYQGYRGVTEGGTLFGFHSIHNRYTAFINDLFGKRPDVKIRKGDFWCRVFLVY